VQSNICITYCKSGLTYEVKALTKSSDLRDEKPLNIKNDRLKALYTHLFSLTKNAKLILTILRRSAQVTQHIIQEL